MIDDIRAEIEKLTIGPTDFVVIKSDNRLSRQALEQIQRFGCRYVTSPLMMLYIACKSFGARHN